MKKIQKQFIHNNYYKGHIQALETIYSPCLSCYTKNVFGPFPSQSGQLKPQSEQKNDKKKFGFVTSIYISLRPKPTSDTNWKRSYIKPSYFSIYIHIGYEIPEQKGIIIMAHIRFLFFFYSSVNWYNLVEYFWYKSWQNNKVGGQNNKATLLQGYQAHDTLKSQCISIHHVLASRAPSLL